MKNQTKKSNWQTIIFAVIVAITFTFVADIRNVMAQENQTENQTIKQFVRQEIGNYKVASEAESDPIKAGFPIALEVRQYKYNVEDTLAIHYTVARYSSAAEAQTALREILNRYKEMNLSIGQILFIRDKDRRKTGIYADMEGKMFVRFWTKDEFIIRTMGVKEDVEEFYTSHQQ